VPRKERKKNKAERELQLNASLTKRLTVAEIGLKGKEAIRLRSWGIKTITLFRARGGSIYQCVGKKGRTTAVVTTGRTRNCCWGVKRDPGEKT